MPYQQKHNVAIAIKRQGARGTAASGASAGYNVFPSQVLKLIKTVIPNNVITRDGQARRDRHGSRHSMCGYQFPLSQGTLDPLLEAGVRGTFTATFDITEATASLASITTTTNTIVAGAGSWITAGVRAGMKVKLTGHSTAGNNGKWLRVLSVTASTITVPAASLTLNAVADTAFTLTVAKYLQNPTTLVERYHTVEELLQDLTTTSKLGTDMKITGFEINVQPDQLVTVTFNFMGLDMAPQASAPILTPLTYATTIPLVMVDGTIRINGTDYSVLTGFSLKWEMGGEVPATLSGTGPDVFLGRGRLTGSFSAIRQDLAFLTAYRSETVMDLFVDFQEPDASDPKDFTSVYVGNVTLSDNAGDDIGESGAMVETVPWAAGYDDTGGTDRVTTTMLISSSAA
jgi:hypothetical protein